MNPAMPYVVPDLTRPVRKLLAYNTEQSEAKRHVARGYALFLFGDVQALVNQLQSVSRPQPVAIEYQDGSAAIVVVSFHHRPICCGISGPAKADQWQDCPLI
jgi:exonuclease VII large subunit